ncbi:uncharacterized protein LOC125224122 [Salvia hispanica]|uniref:uncharacterized protein LOC125224122 n=1 Tax=Salvia hispanica TaxID=49212 RepID=UPI0020096953|nr:uncharacterized protein LOC125224122 [Salvia hispanica]
MNTDVVFEILLHLPVRSLLRFIGVHKSWYYIINSPHFRKLYNLRRNNNIDEEEYLCFTSDIIYGRKQVSLSLLDNGKSLMSYDFQHIDQRILPLPSPLCRRQDFSGHHVGLGFDEDYKVVQLLRCLVHHCLHANMYSARTNSWSELDNIDQDLVIQYPIKSVCKNGSFVHWQGYTRSEHENIILSFDMKNEVFRTITISRRGDQVLDKYFRFWKVFAILAKGERSFIILVVDTCKLEVFESSGEGSELIWNNVNNVDLYYFWNCNFGSTYDIPFWRNDNCVVLKGRTSREVLLYDYCARKFIKRFEMCGTSASEYDIIEYEGSLISP